MIILVVISFLFYQRFQSLRNYSNQLDHSYSVRFFIKDLVDDTQEAEAKSRGYILTRDSSFLIDIEPLYSRITKNADSLKNLFRIREEQYGHAVMLRTIITRRINKMRRNVQKAALDDTIGLNASLMEGKILMEDFTKEARRIEGLEIGKANDNRDKKNLYELLTPGYFNGILMFSGILTLISFFFIIREMRMRLKYQSELERRLNELNRSTSELEQFTYVASHDLQEPLRKIRTFSDRLIGKYKPTLTDDAGHILERIHSSAQRMQELINDMINFTNLVNRHDTAADVDLNLVVEASFRSLSDQIHEKRPILKYDELPIIRGYREQLVILFRSLIDNALKFSKREERPLIHIRYRKVEGTDLMPGSRKGKLFYHQVVVEDNGIGFDNEFASKIFMIFQRLHNQGSPYRGKGIGLAVAQRVMTNHNGIITARGVPGEGATIFMYFPIELS